MPDNPKRKPKAPAGCYWRNKTLWGRTKIKGKEYRWSLQTDDSRIAKKRFNELRQKQIDRSIYGAVEPTLIRDLLPAWDRHIRKEVSEKTVKRYLSSLDQIADHLDGIYLDQIDARLVGEIIQSRQLDEITNATIKRDLVALSSVVNYAILIGKANDNPVVPRMSLISERRDPIALPTDEQISKVIGQAPGMLAQLIEAAWRTGCRQSELVNATRSQFAHNSRQLTVIGKRGKIRVVDLEPFGAFDLFHGLPTAPSIKQPLFWHGTGKHYRNVSSRFRNLCLTSTESDSAFTPFRFHSLRHRHAVDWLKSGRSIYDLQKRLGHESIKTTEIYLAYLTPEEERIVKLQGGTNRGTPNNK
jgi:integrase/recombinase XerD